jgi:hypothetical protein
MHAGQRRGGILASGSRSSLAASIVLVTKTLNTVVALPGVSDKGGTGFDVAFANGCNDAADASVRIAIRYRP